MQINLDLVLIAINFSGILSIDFLEIQYNGRQRFDENKIGHSAKSLGERGWEHEIAYTNKGGPKCPPQSWNV